MKTSTLIVVVIVVLLGGWYWMSQTGTKSTDVVPSTTAGAPVVTIANNATLGDYLVASNGMTLYLSTKDTANVSNCSGACATNWPPYVQTTAEPLVTGAGVTGMLATITRADGGTQLTYNGIPLYFYVSDTKVGDTTGQNVGGYWFVVKP